MKTLHIVNNFCRVCNVNLLCNIWIWKIQLIRWCLFQRAKYSHKVVVLGFPVNKESTVSSVLCMRCRRELGKFEKFFEGLSVFKEKADQTLKEQREVTEWGTNNNNDNN